MGLAAPLGEFVHKPDATFEASCNTKPGVAGDQDKVTSPDPAGVILNVGAPMVCTTCGKTQKPPVRENWALVMAAPASGWPMPPTRENWPFVLVPPPPAILCQSMEY